jgi:hypothetical protein
VANLGALEKVSSEAPFKRSRAKKPGGNMPKVKVTPFRFTDEELELLEVIQGHTGIRSRMEALRTVMQYYAKAEGLDVGPSKESGKPTT